MQVDGEVGRLDEILRIKHLQILMKPSADTLSNCGVCVSKTPLFQFGFRVTEAYSPIITPQPSPVQTTPPTATSVASNVSSDNDESNPERNRSNAAGRSSYNHGILDGQVRTNAHHGHMRFQTAFWRVTEIQ